MKKTLVSTGTIPLSVSTDFTNYRLIHDVIKELDIDGVEFVFLPEWDIIQSPLTNSSASWNECTKATCEEIVKYIREKNINVYSIHLNRDIGNYLCSSDESIVNRGYTILKQNLEAVKEMEVKLLVLHLWDTYSEHVDIEGLFRKVYKIAKDYNVTLTIENIPLSDKNKKIVDVWNILDNIMPKDYGFTLDLTWCSLYDNFEELIKFKDRIFNIHIQGKICYLKDDIKLIPRTGELDLIKILKSEFFKNYDRYVTLELNNPKSITDFNNSINIIKY